MSECFQLAKRPVWDLNHKQKSSFGDTYDQNFPVVKEIVCELQNSQVCGSEACLK